MYNVHVWRDCRRIEYTPSPSLEIILTVKLFVLFGYPRRGGVNIGNLPLSFQCKSPPKLCSASFQCFHIGKL